MHRDRSHKAYFGLFDLRPFVLLPKNKNRKKDLEFVSHLLICLDGAINLIHWSLFAVVTRGWYCPGRRLTFRFPWNRVHNLAMTFLATPATSATLFCVCLDSSLLILRQAMDSGRSHCRDIFQLPLSKKFKKKAERLNFTTEKTKNSNFCKIPVSAIIFHFWFLTSWTLIYIWSFLLFSATLSNVSVLFYVSYQKKYLRNFVKIMYSSKFFCVSDLFHTELCGIQRWRFWQFIVTAWCFVQFERSNPSKIVNWILL